MCGFGGYFPRSKCTPERRATCPRTLSHEGSVAPMMMVRGVNSEEDALETAVGTNAGPEVRTELSAGVSLRRLLPAGRGLGQGSVRRIASSLS